MPQPVSGLGVRPGARPLRRRGRGARRAARRARHRAHRRLLTAATSDDAIYVNGDLAVATTDALQLFLNEAGRYPLLTAAEEVELAKRIERGDKEAKERMINSNLRLVVSIAKKYQGHGLLAARPDPGGDHRADPRGREVRLAPRLQVLDVRHVVDPAGGAARRREQVAHDPDPGAHRRARDEDRPRRARAGRRSSAGRRPTRRSRTPPKLPLKQVREVREAARAVTSLDKPIGSTRATRRSATSSATDERRARGGGERRASPRRRSTRALAALPDREREVLELRYGLDGDSEPTLPRGDRPAAGLDARARAPDRGAGARAARRATARSTRSEKPPDPTEPGLELTLLGRRELGFLPGQHDLGRRIRLPVDAAQRALLRRP